MEDIFIDPLKRTNIKVLYNQEHMVEVLDGVRPCRETFRLILERTEMLSCFVSLPKSNPIFSFININYKFQQIRMTQMNDQTDMYLCSIDSDIFERIKLEQSINVSYSGFIDYLLQILDGCRKEELHVAIISNNGQKFIQLYERRPFKNLTHLYLPLKKADTPTILFHMNQNLSLLQNQLVCSKAQVEALQLDLSDKNTAIETLKQENRQLRGTLKEQENQIFNRNTEEVNRLHQEIKELQNGKETNERKLRQELRIQQDHVDTLTRDLFTTNERLEEEIKKQDLLRTEINRTKHYITENHSLQSELEQAKLKVRRQESKLNELQVLHNDAQLMQHQNDKRVEDLLAQLEAEKRTSKAKRDALQLAGEEVTTANRVIRQKNREIENLKSKCDLRTELALRQEAVIQEKDKQCQELQSILIQLKHEFEATKLKKEEVLDTIQNLQESADSLEDKYKHKIHEVENKLEFAKVRSIKEKLMY